MNEPSLTIGENNNWGIKEGGLLGYRLKNNLYYPRDMSATRATSATVVQKDGSIGDSCWNLLQRSEEFDNTIWGKPNVVISANAITAPNGTLTADKLIEHTTNAGHVINQVSIGNLQGIPITFSIYAKAAERTTISLYPFSSSNGARFDLSTGTILLNDTGITSSISNVGGGWYRCSATFTPITTNALNSQVYLFNGSTTYLGDGISGVYIWGAQTVIGSTPKDYLKTTNRLAVPSIDFSLGSSSPALLVEPARTNLLLNSATGTTQSVSVTAQAYTLSFYGTGSYTLSGTATGTLNGTGANNLVTMTFTPTAGTLTLTVSGSITNVQLEAGSNATSRIITAGGTATRNAYTSFIDLRPSLLLNKDNFTLYVEGYSYNASSNLVQISLNDTTGLGGNTNYLGIYFGFAGLISVGGSTTSFGTVSLPNNTAVKMIIQVNGNQVKYFRNGAQIGTTQTVTPLDYQYLTINTGGGTYAIKKINLWKFTKTDAECIALTT